MKFSNETDLGVRGTPVCRVKERRKSPYKSMWWKSHSKGLEVQLLL